MGQYTVFISHAHADNALCDRFVAALQASGLDVWYDRANMEGGRSLSVEIQKQLAERTAFVVLLSPASANSYWVQLETDAYRDLAAHDRSRLMLPVKILPTEIPLLLRGLKWIDATSETFTEVIAEMTRALGVPAPLPHRPPTPETSETLPPPIPSSRP